MKKYVIVTVLNRETNCEFAETLEQAKSIMQYNLSECIEGCNESEEELIEEVKMDTYETGAWISTDDVHFDIDIFEIK